MKKRNGFGLLATILIIIATAIVSSVATGVILYNSYKEKAITNYSKLSKDKELKEFLEVYYSLTSEYYGDLDKSKMIDAAIEGMTNYLGDKYTTYMSETEKEQLETSLNGKYTGIGVLITDNEIKQVFDDSPAQKSGVKVGDKIIKVDGQDVTDKTAVEIVNLIRKNEKQSTIVFLRNDQEIELTIEFKSLDVPSISYEKYDDGIGYLYIGSFSSSLSKQVKSALDELEKQDIKGLIVDVRDNAGGYLTAAGDVASLFLEKGKVIYSLKNNEGSIAYKDQTEAHKTYPIIVLINENSASSAEILAAALKESYGATLVGKKSYGKGKVQQTKKLKDGSMVKYTSANWLTPKGDCIDEKGIEPDYKVELEVEYNDKQEVVKVNDTQLEKARELLGN